MQGSKGPKSEQEQKLTQNRGGQSPDLMATNRKEIDRLFAATKMPLLSAKDRRIEKGLKRQFKHLGNFEVADLKGIRVGKGADERGDADVMNGEDIVEATEHIDVTANNAHLLLGLPQSRIERSRILRMTPASRKRNLPAMLLEMLAAPSQKQVVATILDEEREKNRRMTRCTVKSPGGMELKSPPNPVTLQHQIVTDRALSRSCAMVAA